MLDDGRYDVIVVSADVGASDAGPRVELSLAITSGEHKGEVVDLVSDALARRDPIDLVGLPCTLVVHEGEPHLEP